MRWRGKIVNWITGGGKAKSMLANGEISLERFQFRHIYTEALHLVSSKILTFVICSDSAYKFILILIPTEHLWVTNFCLCCKAAVSEDSLRFHCSFVHGVVRTRILSGSTGVQDVPTTVQNISETAASLLESKQTCVSVRFLLAFPSCVGNRTSLFSPTLD